ncbi:hypothetical protein VQL36_11600 [Chengkuizengella sp. SCS-71B]|uniref:hypothetical protein n=1 Tax=Chengkuizengella sp. SCS-71B TaxID=3115290 RepID=UPI0032C2270B
MKMERSLLTTKDFRKGMFSITSSKTNLHELNLSDPNVIQWLILYRDQIDIYFNSNANRFFDQAGDVRELNQELINTYIYLDNIIQESQLTDEQLALLKLLFMGYTLYDVATLHHSDVPVRKIKRKFERICNIIWTTNTSKWNRWVHQHVLHTQLKQCKTCLYQLPKVKSHFRKRSDHKGDGFYNVCRACEKRKRNQRKRSDTQFGKNNAEINKLSRNTL